MEQWVLPKAWVFVRLKNLTLFTSAVFQWFTLDVKNAILRPISLLSLADIPSLKGRKLLSVFL